MEIAEGFAQVRGSDRDASILQGLTVAGKGHKGGIGSLLPQSGDKDVFQGGFRGLNAANFDGLGG